MKTLQGCKNEIAKSMHRPYYSWDEFMDDEPSGVAVEQSITNAYNLFLAQSDKSKYKFDVDGLLKFVRSFENDPIHPKLIIEKIKQSQLTKP